MGSIHILDERLVNKIAAGEVVESPAAAIKELIENSLDANATEIKIEVDGLNFRIVDNGSGMSEEDALLCFKRHATSKIIEEADIFSISTLGFRGEALASIAEISRMNIITKQQEAIRLEIEYGKLLGTKQVGAPRGTIVEVKDLFENVPARKKFLKSESVEWQRILKVVTNYALIREDVSFKLSHKGKEVLNSPISHSLLNNILHIYGPELGKDLLDISVEKDGVKITGYIGKPIITRSDKSDQFLYMNNRYVESKVLNDAVYEGFGTTLFVGRHPFYVLNITINPSEIDVNVHPSKRIVKLKNEPLLKELISTCINEQLAKENLVHQVNLENETRAQPTHDYPMQTDRQTVLEPGEAKVEYAEQKEEDKIGPFFILGQVNRMFVVAESPKGLAIIDQHAAHERVNYENFMKSLQNKAVKKQQLAQSKVIELTPVQYTIAMQYKEKLGEMGFDYEDFGQNSIKLHTIPEVFGNLRSTILFDILNEIQQKNVLDEEVEMKITKKACKASVTAGDVLTIPQIRGILDELNICENPYTCPHGRPTIIELSTADLEKKFKRTGW